MKLRWQFERLVVWE